MNAIEIIHIPYVRKPSKSTSPSIPTSRSVINLTLAPVLLLLLFIAGITLILNAHINLGISSHYQYLQAAKQNSLNIEELSPPRSQIISRDGYPLTENKISYDLYVSPQITIDELLSAYPSLHPYQDDIEKRLKSATKTAPVLTLKNIPKEIALQIQNSSIPHVTIKKQTQRYYPTKDITSHIIGYVGLPSPEELKKHPEIGYNDLIGKTGLEKYYDKYLRGTKGQMLVERNSLGQKIASYEIEGQSPIPGPNIQISLDMKLQTHLFTALKDTVEEYEVKGGAAIILDPYSGEILAMAVYPSYDNNTFTDPTLITQRNQIVSNKRLPLFNRATLAQLPPGSTFKTIVASALLEEGVITPTERIRSPGYITLSGGLRFQNYKKRDHGLINVKEALMVSSNVFFCKAALRVGIEPLIPYFQKFGIGQKTGIDLPYEATGRIPTPEEKIKLANTTAPWLEPIWFPEGDTCNSVIGQGITLVTPTQMAKVASIIANGGSPITPHLGVTFIYPDNTTVSLEYPRGETFLSPSTIQAVREGMWMSVHSSRGLLQILKNVPVEVAAKSGTAEFGRKTPDGYLDTHGWVIGFYPYDNPKYAFVVMLEYGGSGAKAARVMYKFLNSVYGQK